MTQIEAEAILAGVTASEFQRRLAEGWQRSDVYIESGVEVPTLRDADYATTILALSQPGLTAQFRVAFARGGGMVSLLNDSRFNQHVHSARRNVGLETGALDPGRPVESMLRVLYSAVPRELLPGFEQGTYRGLVVENHSGSDGIFSGTESIEQTGWLLARLVDFYTGAISSTLRPDDQVLPFLFTCHAAETVRRSDEPFPQGVLIPLADEVGWVDMWSATEKDAVAFRLERPDIESASR
jgi:hypothetical protein